MHHSESEAHPETTAHVVYPQAVAAVNMFNGEELAGRKILVREDREDRDVKQYNKENGIERPEGARPPRRARTRGGSAGAGAAGPGAPPGSGDARPPRREPRGAPPSGDGGEPGVESSGLQVATSRQPAKPAWPRAKQACCRSMEMPATAKLVHATAMQGMLETGYVRPTERRGVLAAGRGAGHPLEVRGRRPARALRGLRRHRGGQGGHQQGRAQPGKADERHLFMRRTSCCTCACSWACMPWTMHSWRAPLCSPPVTVHARKEDIESQASCTGLRHGPFRQPGGRPEGHHRPPRHRSGRAHPHCQV